MFGRPCASLQHSVLIVDQSEESREVLRTALGRRGMQIYEAGGVRQGLDLARRCHPELIVLDLEAVSDVSDAAVKGFHAESLRRNTPMVLLGSIRRYGGDFPTGQFVSKPYHYGPLIRRIESLLEEAPARDRAA